MGADTNNIGGLVVELIDVNGTSAVVLLDDTVEGKIYDAGKKFKDVPAGNYTLVVRSREKASGCVSEGTVEVEVTTGDRCLDAEANNVFQLPADDSGVSLEVILGIAIPAAGVSAFLILVSFLYYKKKKRDLNKAKDKLKKADDAKLDAEIDPMGHPMDGEEDIWTEEPTSTMQAPVAAGDSAAAEKKAVIRKREEELQELVANIKKLSGGKAQLLQEGLI